MRWTLTHCSDRSNTLGEEKRHGVSTRSSLSVWISLMIDKSVLLVHPGKPFFPRGVQGLLTHLHRIGTVQCSTWGGLALVCYKLVRSSLDGQLTSGDFSPHHDIPRFGTTIRDLRLHSPPLISIDHRCKHVRTLVVLQNPTLFVRCKRTSILQPIYFLCATSIAQVFLIAR